MKSRSTLRTGLSLAALALALFGPSLARAQTFSEDFTGGGNNNQWYFYNGACLTAGSSSSTTQPGQIPGCVSIATTYYGPAITALGKSSTDTYLEGGNSGYLGTSSAPATIGATSPDPLGKGALRFTNGQPYGFHENGAIVSASAFPSNQGLEITFKSVTYLGNSGGSGGDGADGMSFYLMDASKAFANNAPGIGAWGGSLAYTCSNSNAPYDGLVGAYLGLGIDEYGNFLNGTTNTLGETGTTASGDNTASGGGYQWNRIGLRGGGAIAWSALSAAYGTNPNNSNLPYYPLSNSATGFVGLDQQCTTAGAGYQYSSANNLCNSCSSGTYYSGNNTCDTCIAGSYDVSSDTCNTCPQGTYNGNNANPQCINICATGTNFVSGTTTCDSCPAPGYVGGTYSNGQCTNSCPTGYAFNSPYCFPNSVGGTSTANGAYCPSGQSLSGTFCFPNGDSYSAGYYCGSGLTISGTSCYPTGDVYSSGYYCGSGNTITGSGSSYYCYPTGDSYSAGHYCPSGNSISGTLCFPNGSSVSGSYYCPSGQTITGTSCYPTGGSYSAGYYCGSGLTISGTNCYPNGDTYAAGYYCASGQAINGTYCYPTGDVFSSGYYCASGKAVGNSGANYYCYPSGDVFASGYYCASGNAVGSSGASYYCYPSTGVFLGGKYCPSGDTITLKSGTTYECCVSPATYNTGTSKCSDGTSATTASTATAATQDTTMATAASAATAVTTFATAAGSAQLAAAATVAPPAMAASAATAATAAQTANKATTVTANQVTPTAIAPTQGTPSTAATKTAYPDSVYSVQNTCKTGNLWNYANGINSPTSAGAAVYSTASPGNAGNTANIMDYAAIPGAYSVISGVKIANESAQTRSAASPIYYDLKLTQDGLLTLSYSLSGAAYQTVIKNQPITSSNGPLPSNFLFGFAGSTGGANNIHEIMCFKAVPSAESGGSTAVNEKQSAKIDSTTQAYFGYYDPTPTVWTGDLTANYLIDNNGIVTVATTANWSASCNLSGVLSGFGSFTSCFRTGSTASQPALAPSNRTILTWNGTQGVGLEYANLNSTQQTVIDFGDTTQNANRVNFLRGDRTNEFGNTAGTQQFRRRDGVLADIVDSSPTWVGPPMSAYTANWVDRLYPAAVTPENATANSYVSFVNNEQTRQNVVYVGSNDGLLHGFRTGSFDVNGNFVNNAATPNDGQEVLAYMPGSTISSTASFLSAVNPTQSQVQEIHGYTPGNASASPATVTAITAGDDYSGTQYGHNFFVDATPGTGDLYYGNAWHTWLVGGLGIGGAAIFALDITNPGNFSESNAASLVMGEWNPATITCVSNATCGNSLGNTFGTPQIRRFHNGQWGAVFGNGFGSINGDSGIFVMLVNPSTAAITFYYIGTGVTGGNGIAYVAAADLDGDHITDYVYAGDLLGNVWRFDLTSNNPANWTVGSNPLFTTQAGQPITSQPVVATIPVTGGNPLIMVAFGTGQRTQLTNVNSTTYANGQQDLYGVWDWNMSGWNAMSSTQYAYLLAPNGTQTTNTTGLTAPYVLSVNNLEQQTATYISATGTYDGSNNQICWQGSTACSSGNTEFGWYLNLPASSEQIIYNPTFYQGAFVVDSVIPASNSPTSCAVSLDTGFTYAISIANGGVLPSTNGNPPFPGYPDANTIGVQTNATGTPYIVKTVEGTTALVYQTVGGTPGSQQFNPPKNVKAGRLTWIELR